VSSIWIASPPEVHSALLSSGPGEGPLLAAAAAWNELSAEYAVAATELTELLATVCAGAWEGPTAGRYLAAHQPYLVWLVRASVDAAETAAQHHAAASAYTAALAAMPTMPELATNHIAHGALVATNFFGINTIPVALNEADYARMWVQAAATMDLYQAVAVSALRSAPRIGPAPFVVKPGGRAAAHITAAATPWWQWLLHLVERLLQAYIHFFSWMFDQIVGFLKHPLENTIQILLAFLTNPEAAIITYGPLLFALGYEIFFNLVGWPSWAVLLGSPFLIPIALSLGLGGLMLLPTVQAAPSAMQTPQGTAPAGESRWPATAAPVTAVSTTVTGSSGTVSSGLGAPPSAAAPAGGDISYAVNAIGDWWPDSGPPLGRPRSSVRPAGASTPAAAAQAPNAMRRRVRRRSRTELPDHRGEFMEVDSEVGVGIECRASDAPDRAAGPMGFAGTTHKDAMRPAAGLIVLTGEDFGGGPRIPMPPGSWGAAREAAGPPTEQDVAGANGG
jgi:PPE-repeat protein